MIRGMHNRSPWTFIARCGRILRPRRYKRRLQAGSGCVGGGGGWARSEDLASNPYKQGFGDAPVLVLSPFVKNLELTMIHICARLARSSRQRLPLTENGRLRLMLLRIFETLVLSDGSDANTAVTLNALLTYCSNWFLENSFLPNIF